MVEAGVWERVVGASVHPREEDGRKRGDDTAAGDDESAIPRANTQSGTESAGSEGCGREGWGSVGSRSCLRHAWY
eukprot:1859031-Rhodomonas_salina.1